MPEPTPTPEGATENSSEGQQEPGTEPQTPPEGGAATPDNKTTFDADYVKGLRNESAGYRTKLRDTEAAVADLSAKVQTFEAERPALETRAASAESLAQKYEVALEKGLSLAIAKRLQGATRDELLADAEALAAALGAQTPPLPDLGQGDGRGGSTPPKRDVNAALRAFVNR